VKLVMTVIGWLTCCETRYIKNFLPSGETLKKGVVSIVHWLTSVFGAPNFSAPPASVTETETAEPNGPVRAKRVARIRLRPLARLHKQDVELASVLPRRLPARGSIACVSGR